VAHHLETVALGDAHQRLGLGRLLEVAKPDLPQPYTRLGHLLEVLLGQPGLKDDRPGIDLHPAGAKALVGLVGGDRQRLDAHGILRHPRQMHLAGRHHPGHPAVHIALDEAQGVLAGSPVAQHDVDVGVDEAGRQGRALDVDPDVGGGRVDLGPIADLADQPIFDQDGVGLQHSPIQVAADDAPDVDQRQTGHLRLTFPNRSRQAEAAHSLPGEHAGYRRSGCRPGRCRRPARTVRRT